MEDVIQEVTDLFNTRISFEAVAFCQTVTGGGAGGPSPEGPGGSGGGGQKSSPRNRRNGRYPPSTTSAQG